MAGWRGIVRLELTTPSRHASLTPISRPNNVKIEMARNRISRDMTSRGAAPSCV